MSKLFFWLVWQWRFWPERVPWCVANVYPFSVKLTDEEIGYAKSLEPLA